MNPEIAMQPKTKAPLLSPLARPRARFDPRALPSPAWLGVLLALTSGCKLAVDADLTRPDDAGSAWVAAQPDAALSDASEPAPVEAGSDEDGGSLWPDAQADDASILRPDAQADDGSILRPDAQVDDASVACSSDSSCGADAFCTVSGACAPRCDEQRGCAGPLAGGYVTELAAYGDTIYWSTTPATDTVGNPLNHGLIFSWNRYAAPSPPTGWEGGETLLFVSDGFVYYMRPGADLLSTLYRRAIVPMDAASVLLADNVTRAWKTADHIVWSVSTGGGEELWRMGRTGAASPERVAITQVGSWTASNATFAVRFVGGSQVVVRLSDLSVYGTIDVSGSAASLEAAADEQSFFFGRHNELRRADFSDLSQSKILATGLMPGSIAAKPSGGWVYWTGFSSTHGLGRAQRDALVEPQILFPVAHIMVPLKNELVYYQHEENRIFIKQMPPLPCSAAMPCPEDMSCGSDLFCH